MKTNIKNQNKSKQKGISLFVVMVMLLLTALLVMGTLRVALFNESIVGNQADKQRSQAAAEALVAQAERDIVSGGIRCTAATCRFPKNLQYLEQIQSRIGVNKCGKTTQDLGVCLPDSPTNQNFYVSAILKDKDATDTNPMGKNTAGKYTEFATGATTGDANLGIGDRGLYWVEIFEYVQDVSSDGGLLNVPIPDVSYPFVFRITAYAPGLKAGTGTVLRTFYVPRPIQASQFGTT